jgi:hypothetical protein
MTELGHDTVVLLTATINPGNVPYLVRRDPLVRSEDYKSALRSWLADPLPCPIVFCENSGYDLTAVESLCGGHDKRIEFLSLREDAATFPRGKGYGEVGIVGYALKESSLLRNARRVLKVSGRVYVPNASALVASMDRLPAVDVFCDLRRNLTWGNSRVFCASKDVLTNHLVPRRCLIDDSRGLFLEHALARAVHGVMAEGGRWSHLPVAPVVTGISGTSNRALPDDPGYVAALRLFRLAKTLVLRA